MLRRHTLSALALAATLAASPLAAQAVAQLDQAAPAFTAQGADGKLASLAAYRGKTVVLEWTNHDCPFVKKHYDSGNIPSLQKEAIAKDVVWLQVVSSAPAAQGHVTGAAAIQINKYREASPTATVLDPDGKVGRLYGAQTTPHLFIVNAAGQLVYKGGIDSIPSSNQADIPKAQNYVRLALADIAAGRPVAQASTRPYGCSVKYSD